MLFNKEYQKYLPLTSVGLQLGLSVIACSLIGLWIDDTYQTKPWFSIIGLAMGFAAGIRSIMKEWNRWKKKHMSENTDND